MAEEIPPLDPAPPLANAAADNGMSPEPTAPGRPAAARARLSAGLLAGVAIALLALVETAVALIAPLRAPTQADWEGAARHVRNGHRAGDLVVAAPTWADAILRVHLGDLIPPEIAGRLDDERFGRVWEIGQRGAHAPAAARGEVRDERRFGRLTVRLVERRPEVVRYDFVERWRDAEVRRREGSDPSGIPCRDTGERIQCPDIVHNYVRRQIVEVDTSLRLALFAHPVPHAAVVIEYPAVPLGRTLVIGTGLHNVWMRKEAQGPVELRVVSPGILDVTFTTRNEDGWKRTRIDTSAHAGATVPVRFEVTSPAPHARHFALAAEARE